MVYSTNLFKLLVTTLALVLFLQTPTSAKADYSAVAQKGSKFDDRSLKLKTYLERQDSPLSPHVDDFIKIADKYGIRYSLLPAISGRESTFGKHIPYGSYNCYGWGPSIRFQSWEDGIEKVAKGLKENYIQKGNRTTVDQIAKMYAQSQTWSSGVNSFIYEIENTKISSERHVLKPSL